MKRHHRAPSSGEKIRLDPEPRPGRPPRPQAVDYDLPDQVRCPFCELTETELHSPFGPQLSVASYWCNRCHTAFDWLKWRS